MKHAVIISTCNEIATVSASAIVLSKFYSTVLQMHIVSSVP